MRRFPIYLSLAALLLNGCQISSRNAMSNQSGRESYNTTLQKTTNEQMLLNLVRLRYVDFPFFLDVSNITTQFSLGGKGSVSLPVPADYNKKSATIGGELNWHNTPTISYSPLEGQTFARQLFRPIDLITVQQLIYSGWDVDRVLRLCVQSLNDLHNAPTTSGPLPDLEPEFKDFMQMSELLRYFQAKGQLQLGIKVDPNSEFFLGQGIQFMFPAEGGKSKELADILKTCTIKDEHYIFDVSLGFNKGINNGILPRSLMGTMYYLSVGVEVPKSHHHAVSLKKPMAEGECEFNWREVIGDLITIESSRAFPKQAFVAVNYRDHWYYISDCDMQSKRTFVLLLQLYNLQSSSPKQAAPVLTLPLG